MYFQFSILKHTIIYPQTCCPYIRFLKFKYIHDTNVFDEIVTNKIHVIFANQSQLLVLFKQKLIATESCIAIYLEYFDRRRYFGLDNCFLNAEPFLSMYFRQFKTEIYHKKGLAY